jgi:hypothetical protein
VTIGWHGIRGLFGRDEGISDSISCFADASVALGRPALRAAGQSLSAIKEFKKRTESRSGTARDLRDMVSRKISALRADGELYSCRLYHRTSRLDGLDMLLSILSCQKADGGFELDEEVCELIGIELGEIKSIAKEMEVGVIRALDKFAILSTAILLEVLEIHFSNTRDNWWSVTKKTLDWFNNITTAYSPRIHKKEVRVWAKDFVERNVVISLA